MSEEQYYIRVRGRVQGPFSTEQLHSLAKRGQFSRLHEVSSDGTTWNRASDSPSLFPVRSVTVTIAAQAAAPENTQEVFDLEPPAPAPAPAAAPPTAPQVAWYCNRAGAQTGPYDLETLRNLVQSGQIRGDDLAWSAGMPSWLPVNQISGMHLPSALSPPSFPASHTAQAGPVEDAGTSGMAIAAVVLGMLAAALTTGSVVLSLLVSPAISIGGWLTALFVSVLAVIFGHAARKQIRRAPDRFTGSGLALTGLIMAYVVLATAGFIAIFLIVMFFVAAVGVRAAMPS